MGHQTHFIYLSLILMVTVIQNLLSFFKDEHPVVSIKAKSNVDINKIK